MCPLKQKEKSARIAFDQGVYIGVKNQTNEMVETGYYWDMSWSLVDSHLFSNIPYDWEILKLFFILNNIVPTWIDCKGVDTLYYKDKNGTWSGCMVEKVCF